MFVNDEWHTNKYNVHFLNIAATFWPKKMRKNATNITNLKKSFGIILNNSGKKADH